MTDRRRGAQLGRAAWATVLLAVATIATAWSGYQSTRWNGGDSEGRVPTRWGFESAKAAGLAKHQTR